MGEPGGGQRVFDMCLKALQVCLAVQFTVYELKLARQNGYRHFDTVSVLAKCQRSTRYICVTLGSWIWYAFYLDPLFRHARYLANEKMVGEAIRASGIPRSEIFVTTKLA